MEVCMLKDDLMKLAAAKFEYDFGRKPQDNELGTYSEKLAKELDTLVTSGCAINYPAPARMN